MSVRVLFLDAAPFQGGAQRSLADLLQNLDPAKIQPFLLAADAHPGGLLDMARDRHLPAAPLAVHPWQRDWHGAMLAARELLNVRRSLRQFCSEHQIDLLYANGLQAGLIATLDGPRHVPVILHHRDFRASPRILRYVVRHARTTVAVSDFVRDEVLRLVGEGAAARVTTIANGIDTARLLDRSTLLDFRKVCDLPAARRLVVLGADLMRWKKQDLLLAALAEARQQDPLLTAIFLGGARDAEGERYEAELLRQAETLGIAESIHFTGHLEEPAPILNAADVIVSCATDEPFGRSVLEGLALGKVVTMVRGGGPAALFGQSPAVKVVEPTPAALAAGLRAWFAPGVDRQALATAARQAATPYTIAAHVDRITQVITAAVGHA